MTYSLLTRLIDTLAPRTCVCCDDRLFIDEIDFCHPCFQGLPYTGLESDFLNNTMAQQFWGLMPVERCFAFIRHIPKTNTAKAVYRMKYGHDPQFCRRMGGRMAQKIHPLGFFEGVDAIVPIPLTEQRMRERGYNQCHEMARGVAKVTGLPVLENVVRRRSFHVSQTRMMHTDRMSNVNGVFEVVDASALNGKHILLMDDVMTTGSTVMACGLPILEAADVRISVLTWAIIRS